MRTQDGASDFSNSPTRAAVAGPARFNAVETSLSAIFGPPGSVPPTVAPRALPVVIPMPTRRRRSKILTGVTLATIAALAGVAMGVAVFDGTGAPADAPAGRSVAMAPSVKAASLPAALPLPTASANIAVAAPPVMDARDPTPPSGATIDADDREDTGRGATITRDLPPRATRVGARAPTSAVRTSRRSACSGRRGEASFACLVERLDAADQDLVEAYGSATEAGVPRAHLININRRWVRARDRARDDPADALQSYEELADELWTARRRELRDDD